MDSELEKIEANIFFRLLNLFLGVVPEEFRNWREFAFFRNLGLKIILARPASYNFRTLETGKRSSFF